MKFYKILSLFGLHSLLFLSLIFITNTSGIMGCGGGGDSDDETEMVDADADGFEMYASVDSDWSYDTENDYADGIDCDDDDATVYPGATETAGDSVDQDCDGYDVDADIECTGSYSDCDDDGTPDSCDSDPYDSTDATILTGEDGCDVETVDGEYYVGDGYMDISCNTYESSYGYTVSADGIYDSTGTYVGPRTLCDNCPTTANSDQADSDGDGVGDACPTTDCEVDADEDNACDTDVDGDGTVDDNCVGTFNPYVTDSDEDGTLDTQADADEDGTGDECDSFTDADGDGYSTEGDENGENIDCDDSNATVYPENGREDEEGIDENGVQDLNCDGVTADVENAIYINPSITSSGNGSIASPYNELTDTIIDEAGDDKKTIYIFEGELSLYESLTIDNDAKIYGGLYCEEVDTWECSDTTLLRRDISNHPTKIVTKYVTDRFSIQFEGNSTATIDGIYFTSEEPEEDDEEMWDDFDYYFYIENSSPTISNCEIEPGDDGYSPFYIQVDNGITVSPTIQNNVFNINAADGIYVNVLDDSSFAPLIEGNQIEMQGTASASYPIRIIRSQEPSDPENSVVQIIGNEIETQTAQYTYGIYLENTAAQIDNNKIETKGGDTCSSYCYTYGIYIKNNSGVSSGTNEIYNNLIQTATGGSAHYIYNIYLNNADASIYNNTLSAGLKASGSGIDVGLFISQFKDKDIQLVNNLFVTENSGAIAIYESYDYTDPDADDVNPTIIKNNFFDTTFGGYYYNARYYEECDSDHADYDAFLCAWNLVGASSTTSLSGMNDDGNGNYSGCDECESNAAYSPEELDLESSFEPNNDSVVINVGADVEVGETDANGNQRIVDTIDVGCFEYQSSE